MGMENEMEEWIKAVLQSQGLAGVVILILGISVYRLFEKSERVTRERLTDIPVIIKALENSAQATRENAQAMQARNAITEELTRAIDRQATAFQMFSQKADFEQSALKDKLSEYKVTIDAIAEANRSMTGVLRDIRNQQQGNNVGGI